MYTGVIILNYNSADETINCIQSIEKYNSSPIKYIIVDNGSSDHNGINFIKSYIAQLSTPHIILNESEPSPKELPYITFLISNQNDGYAIGNNKGLNLAYSDKSIDSLLIINNDVLFTEDLIPSFLDFYHNNPECGILSPLLLTSESVIDHCCARRAANNWDIILTFLLFKRDVFGILTRISRRQKILLSHPDLLHKKAFPIEMPSGSCMFVSKELFKSLGSFDPHTFLYYEENILAKKLSSRGRTSYCLPKIKCTHLGAGSTRRIRNILLQKYNLDSANYYLSTFGDMSFIQTFLWKLTVALWGIKFHVVR